jgi:hypothetical protein
MSTDLGCRIPESWRHLFQERCDRPGCEGRSPGRASPDLSSTSQLILSHRFNFEKTPAFGGELTTRAEVSTNGSTTWIDVPDSNIGRYDSTIVSDTGSPIAGRDRISNSSAGFPDTINEVKVNLGTLREYGYRCPLTPRTRRTAHRIPPVVGRRVQFTNLDQSAARSPDDTAHSVKGFPSPST